MFEVKVNSFFVFVTSLDNCVQSYRENSIFNKLLFGKKIANPSNRMPQRQLIYKQFVCIVVIYAKTVCYCFILVLLLPH